MQTGKRDESSSAAVAAPLLSRLNCLSAASAARRLGFECLEHSEGETLIAAAELLPDLRDALLAVEKLNHSPYPEGDIIAAATYRQAERDAWARVREVLIKAGG
jgi:hypothetical protein